MTNSFVANPLVEAQRGAALVVCLIMLLLLTLVGVAGMKDTLLQQKMVSGTKDREIALQAAESALRQAETFLGRPTAPPMAGNGLYDLTEGTDIALFADRKTAKSEPDFWRNNWNWDAADSVEYTFALSGVEVDTPPRYVVEKLDVALSSRTGYAKNGGECSVVCSEDLNVDFIKSPDPVSDYRVTVKAVGSTTDSEVIVQSTFRRDKE